MLYRDRRAHLLADDVAYELATPEVRTCISCSVSVCFCKFVGIFVSRLHEEKGFGLIILGLLPVRALAVAKLSTHES